MVTNRAQGPHRFDSCGFLLSGWGLRSGWEVVTWGVVGATPHVVFRAKVRGRGEVIGGYPVVDD